MKRLCSALVLLVMLSSCKNEPTRVERAFYYWKNSSYSLDEAELKCLKQQKVKKLYVKFFEVDYDSILIAVPSAKSELHLQASSSTWGKDTIYNDEMKQLEVVPTVYLRNKIFYHTTRQNLDTLADNILFLVNKYYKAKIKNREEDYSEIQLDCDWTLKTQDHYFYLLNRIKALSKKYVSCTLRLYPYKFRERMGFPPVDRAVLMCYNLIKPLESKNSNSILSTDELEKYLKNVKKYPLHLDVALPLFSWIQVYQNNQFAGLISSVPQKLKDAMKWKSPLWYEVTKNIEMDHIYLHAGDKLKVEDVSPEDIRKATELIKKHVTLDPETKIILFHLDSQTLNKYKDEAIGHFYSDFSL